MSASYNVCDGINTGIMILWGKWLRKFPPFVNYNILHNGYTIMYSSVNKNFLLSDNKPLNPIQGGGAKTPAGTFFVKF